MVKVLTTAVAGVVLGLVLKAAEHFGVMPWALGFMFACLATNIIRLTAEFTANGR